MPVISSAMQVGKGTKFGLETRGGTNQLEDASEKESSHRQSTALANITSTGAEVQGGEMWRVFFKACRSLVLLTP